MTREEERIFCVNLFEDVVNIKVNQRRDFLHKESFKLVSENQTIAIEDLNIKVC